MYQRKRQKKMQRKLDEEADLRKGFQLTADGEPIHLPLVYGYQRVGGVRTYHNTTNSYALQTLPANNQRFQTNLPPTASSATPDYLWIQQAICFGGIDSIIDVEVDGLNWDDPSFRHMVEFSRTGSQANPTGSANGIPATNTFSNIAYLTGLFSLNRDDPQYNNVPDVSAFVRGNRVNTINLSGSTYSLSPTKVFSNNPAYVLLDYLLRPKQLGGCGYDLSDIDLRSFYNAAQLCDSIIEMNVPVKGRANGIRPVAAGQPSSNNLRNLRLYECNITIDTNETRRDNIERILETMAQSELIWSEGRYKLVLDYPSSEAAQNALITATYTDDNIVNSAIDIVWAGVQDKFNRATVKFLNEEQEFATDSVSYPPFNSAQHQAYLADDNGIENEIEYFLQGGTHRRSALAKAEELVRNSRISKIINFELNREALVHEQGDLISINSEAAGIDNEVYRIEEMTITPNLSVLISAVRFDYRTLAYNVSDSYITNPRTFLPTGVPNVSNLTWNEGSRVGELSNGWLSWTPPNDDSVRRYLIYYRTVAGNYVPLGESRTPYFDIPSELSNGVDYYFLVRTENSRGRLSEGAIIFLDQLPMLVPLTGAIASAGVNSVRVSWSDPHPELAFRYDIYAASTNNRASAVRIGSSTTDSFVLAPAPIDNYYFWVDIIGRDGAVAQMTAPSFVSALSLGISTADIPALEAIEQYMTDSVFLRAAEGSATSELALATYSDGTIDVSTARIRADAILLDGSVSMNQLTVTDLSGNLVNNGDFSFGDLRGWTPDGGTWEVADKADTGGNAVINMPSAHALRAPASPSVNVHHRQSQPFACVAGDRFSISYRLAGDGSGVNLNVGAQLVWLNESNAVVSVESVVQNGYSSTTWTIIGPQALVAPAGARYGRLRMYVLGGSSGTAYFTDIRCEKQRSAQILITPNSITGAQLVQTEALITQTAQLGDAVVNNAKIANGAITNAKIGNLQVTNANIANLTVAGEKIQNNAVTATAAATGAPAFNSGFVSVAGVGITCLGGRPLVVTVSGDIYPTGEQRNSVLGRIIRSGQVVADFPIGTPTYDIMGGEASIAVPRNMSFSKTVVLSSWGGYQDLFLQIRKETSGGPNWGSNGLVFGMEIKK